MRFGKRTTIAILAVAVVLIGLAVAIGAFNTAPKLPDVKFIEFSPEGRQTIKPDQLITVSFKVRNNAQSDVSNARVDTTFTGDTRFFIVDKPVIQLPIIYAPEGESAKQTVLIRGANLGDQDAVESKFSITLYVGTDITDKRELGVRLEK